MNPVIIEEKQDDGHIKSKIDSFKTVTEKLANGMIETSFSWNKNIYRNVYSIGAKLTSRGEKVRVGKHTD